VSAGPIADLLVGRVSPDAAAWLAAALEDMKQPDRLAPRWSGAGRRLGKGALALDPAELERLRAGGAPFVPQGWGADECGRALLLDGLIARAQDPHPGDAPALGAVVGLLLDQVVAAGAAHAHPVGDMLALRHLAGADRAQLQDVGPGAEPVLEDDLLGHLPAGGGLPVPPGRQGLEVDRVGQQRAQRSAVLGRHGPRKVLTRSNHRVPPAAIMAGSRPHKS